MSNKFPADLCTPETLVGQKVEFVPAGRHLEVLVNGALAVIALETGDGCWFLTRPYAFKSVADFEKAKAFHGVGTPKSAHALRAMVRRDLGWYLRRFGVPSA